MAIISESEYQSAQTETFLGKVYDKNAKGLVSMLIQNEWLSAADYEDLKNYWKGGDVPDE